MSYWTLGEPAGATQANSSVNGAPPLTLTGTGAPVVFGNATGPGTDDLTAAEFAGGQYLSGPAPSLGASFTYECFFLRTGAPLATETLMYGEGTSLTINTSGQVVGAHGTLVSPLSYADGSTHHAAVTHNLTTGACELFIDGHPVVAGSRITVKPDPGILHLGAGQSGLSPFTGVLAHVALFGRILDDTSILVHALAGLTGFAGERTDTRLLRYAALADIPAAEVNAQVGSTAMAHLDTTGQQVVEMLRQVETTEGGVLFDARDGTLTLHNRRQRYTATSAFTLSMRMHEVEADYSPRLDRSSLLNDVTVSNTSGTVTARVTDGTSIGEYGVAGSSVTTASQDANEPRNLASWLVYTYAEPKPRVPSLSVDVLAQVDKWADIGDLLDATIGTKITVSNHPSQAAATSVDYFVEGYTETYGPESLQITFNLSPSAPYDQVLILDDPVRGAIDSNALAF